MGERQLLTGSKMGSVCSKEICAEIEELCYLMFLGHDKFAEERESLTENEIPSFSY